MKVHAPRRIVVEAEVAGSPLAASLRERLPDAEYREVERLCANREHDPHAVEVSAFRGRFLKDCPGTKHYLCCGYRILHFGVNCSLGCTYCILQAYLNQPNLMVFGNIHTLFEELNRELRDHPDALYRIGTGEFTDSLLLDPWTGFSRLLVPFFSRLPNAVIELKTKTDFIDNLEDLDHGGHCLVAWSLSSERVRREEEPRAASLDERIRAARRCVDWGYPLAFHFDPMIDHPGWRHGYGETLDRVFGALDPGRIVWMSLGAFRFMPDLKAILKKKHPRSRILSGELIRGLDEKQRYFRDIRVDLYRFMVERIRRVDPGICVYLCMEGADIWREVFGFSPTERGGLPAMLDTAVKDRMKIGTHCSRSADSLDGEVVQPA